MSTPVNEYKPGDLVEGYRVLRLMGSGAASHIYVVQDPKTKEIWALKHVEKHEHKDSRFLDQALLEADVASRLNHASIRRIERVVKRLKLLRVTDIFLVMEFVDGISMEKDPPREDLPLALHIFEQVAQALTHMHDRGFVHADMKPNNVMVCENEVAKIIDLGQSCPIGTVKPRIQGTPDYIAPEQVHRHPITPRTDVYNFGATMYWVLSGQNIPTALSNKSDSLVGKVDAKLLQKAKPVRELNPNVPARLNDLIMHCIEPDPEKRPPNMAVVADQLNLISSIVKTRGKAASGDSRAGGSGAPIHSRPPVGGGSA